MIVGFCLAVLIVLTFISVILGNSFIADYMESTIDTEAIVEGNPSTFFVESADVYFYMPEGIGIVALVIALITIATLVGVQVLGSGLSDSSVRTITIATFYAGIWATLSILSYPLIADIEIFGGILYVGLTLVYSIGVGKIIAGGND